MDCKTRIRQLREETGMNRREFCEYFKIPYRTVTEWEHDNRHAPDYVLDLLEYYIAAEKPGKKEAEPESSRSTFPDPVDYAGAARRLTALSEGVEDAVAILANAAALIYELLPDINWAGFYGMKKGELVLGPFQGKTACVRIPVGRGVCGTAVERNETILVENVHHFPGHIACDSASLSEIVIPVRTGGEIRGVLDIDSPREGRFREADREGLEALVRVLEKELTRHRVEDESHE